MKKIFLLTLYVVISACSFSQERPAENYLAKAKKQNTAAWVLLGGGFTFTAAGVIGGSTSVMNEIGARFNDEHDKGYKTSSVFFILGITSMLSSIPFFVASSGNRKKAATVFFKLEAAPSVTREMLAKNNFPAIGIKLLL